MSKYFPFLCKVDLKEFLKTMGQYFLKRNKVKTGGSFCCKIIYQLQLNVTQVDGNFSFDDDVMSCHERVS